MRQSKIAQFTLVLATLGAFVGAIFFLASLQTKVDAKSYETKNDTKVEAVEFRQNEIEKCFAEQKTDIKYIKEGIKEIKRMVK